MIISTQNRATIAKVMFLGFLLATLLLAWSPLVGTEPAQAALPTDSGKIAFASNRTTGTGVNNPQGDYEIFIMSPDGTNTKQLTRNAVDDFEATLSSDGKKVAYASRGDQTSNPQRDTEIYLVNALDGSGKKNLTNNRGGVEDSAPDFSPNGQRIVYESYGAQTSNPQGDPEVYVMSALDGTGKKNLTNTAEGVHDFSPAFSPDGQRIAFTSFGAQTSNPEGDYDVYTMNALDGSGQSNFTFTSGGGVTDYGPTFSPDGQKIAFSSRGTQPSNPEGDYEVYVRNTSGLGEINLTNNGADVRDFLRDFSPDGRKVTYYSHGIQTSNPEGDSEIYSLNTLDGLGKKNLTNNKASDTDPD